MINSQKNLKLSKNASKPLKFWGAGLRHLRRRNAFGLIQEYCKMTR